MKAKRAEIGAGAAQAAKVSSPIDLTQHLPSRIIILANGLALHAYRLYSSKLGLKTGDWRLLSALGSRSPISYNELAQSIGMDRAGISRTIASLVRRGYVSRITDPRDRRQSTLSLTKKGIMVHDKIAPIARAREQRLIGALTREEYHALDRILAKLQQAVDTMLAETSPSP